MTSLPTSEVTVHSRPATIYEPPTHINDIPPELLVTIMTLTMDEKVASDHVWHPDIERRVPFDPELSHVCRRWRTIALASPGLWSVLQVAANGLKWMELCLSRCVGVPIDFEVLYSARWEESQCQKVIRSMLPHLGRARTISVHFNDGPVRVDEGPIFPENILFVRYIADCLLAQPMPWLEDVDVQFPWDAGEHAVYSGSLPELLLSQTIPRLWRLELSCCIIMPLSLPPACSLRQLVLEDVQCWRDVDDMVRCLQATPCLEQLIYEDYNTFDGTTFFDSTRSRNYPLRCVHLNHLADLDIFGSFNTCVSIFSYLAIPCTARIDTGRRDYDDLKQDPTAHFAMLAEAFTEHFVSTSTAGVYFKSVNIGKFRIYARGSTDEKNLSPQLGFYISMNTSTEESVESLFDLIDTCKSLHVFRSADSFKFTDDFLYSYPEYLTRSAAPTAIGPGAAINDMVVDTTP